MTLPLLPPLDAYGSARAATAPQPGTGAGTGGGVLGRLGADFAQTLATGERTAMAAMTGQADSQALVQTLTQTELAVETAVTVRNKVVEAYQEILRMPV